MRRALSITVVVLACYLGLPSPVAAQQAPSPLADLVRAGAPLGASTGMPSGSDTTVAAAAPVAPTAPTSPSDPRLGLPNPLDLFSALDPREWAGAILDTVIETLAGAVLDAIRDFVDWALGLGGSSLNIITRTPAAGTYESPTVRALWDLSRGFANGALALIVMWGGFNVVVRQHLRSPYDGAMELLPRLLIAALAANLSLDIVRVLVELNNAVAAAVGDAGLPGYDQATSTQAGMATVMVAVTYGVVALLLAFQMLMRLALICVLAVLGPAMVVCWVLPQTQGWARWWAHLLPITVLQQCVQVLVLKLGSSLMVELAPGDAANAVLTLLLGIAVCYLTLRVPSLLSSQARHAGLSSVVSLVVLSRFAGGLGARGAAVAGAGAR